MSVGQSKPTVPSPCIQVCRLDSQQRYCEGCWRTVDEIAAWSGLSNGQKIRLWRELGQRRQGLLGGLG